MLLTDREVETLILAVKYWSRHRRSEVRRGDNLLTPEETDALLAKFKCEILSSAPSSVKLDLERFFHD